MPPLTAAEVREYIVATLTHVGCVDADGDSYFFYNPDGTPLAEHKFPIATLVTGDRHDRFSDLDRPGVFRLNIGVGKATFQKLFPPAASDDAAPQSAAVEGGVPTYDFTATDRLLPHPVYGMMYWLCVLNPAERTWDATKQLLDEAQAAAEKKHATGENA